MNVALPLGWTGSFDQEASVLHLATSDRTRAASVSFKPAPEHLGDGVLDRATAFLEADIHRRAHASWQATGGRLPVGGCALVQSRSAERGEVVNGSSSGYLRRHRAGEIIFGGRTYRLRHPTRWRSVVEVEGQQIAVLTRRLLSRRTVPLERMSLPVVESAAVTEPDQLAVVLAASVLGPPGRTGFWGEVGGELVP